MSKTIITLENFYVYNHFQAGDPGPALSRWSVSPGPVIQTNDAWSSSDEETDFINKFQNSCFASDSEDDEVCHSADS